MDDLDGRVAVVTGAASGIGLALTELFASERARVVMADLDANRLDREASRLRALGLDVVDVVTDVGDSGSVDALATATVDAFGQVDVLCNNAGTIAFGTVWEMGLDDWERVLRVNLLSVLHGLRSFVPIMRSSGDDGHIVNTASMAAFMRLGGVPPYVTSKHAVVGLSEALAEDLEQVGSGIGVSVVCPGMVATRFGQPDAEIPPDDQLPDGIVSAASAAETIRRAIAARRMYVFTHASSIVEVQERYDRILTGFD